MFKYATEEAVNLQLLNYQIAQQDELDIIDFETQFNSENPCTIYFICTRQRIIIDYTYIKKKGDQVELRFKVQSEFNFSDYLILLNLPDVVGNLSINTKFPFNYFELRDEKGIIYGGKSAYIIEQFKNQLKNSEFTDYNVLYIGQSVDEIDSIPTVKRIKKHDKLQLIYSEAVKNYPDKEIYLLLASFKQTNYLELRGDTVISRENEYKDSEKFEKLIFNPSKFTLEQRTTFCEAALIKYFQPKYNKEYKGTFPDKKHKSYSECYDSDINSIMIELDFSGVKSMFFSEMVNRKVYHNAHFYLHDKNERRRMFMDL
jgi:hypothetical protein